MLMIAWFGKSDGIDELIVELNTSGFNLKVENNLANYVSCQLIEKAESKKLLILQPHLINNVEVKFGDKVKSKRVYNTPRALALKMMKT
jgi:hypothetical protein